MPTSQANVSMQNPVENAKFLSTGAFTDRGRPAACSESECVPSWDAGAARSRWPPTRGSAGLSRADGGRVLDTLRGSRNAVEALVVEANRQFVLGSRSHIEEAPQTARLSTIIEDDARREPPKPFLAWASRLFSERREKLPIEMWGLINFYHARERGLRSSNQDDVNNPAKLVRELQLDRGWLRHWLLHAIRRAA